METLNPNQLADEGQAEYKKGQYLSAAKLFKAAAEGFLAAGAQLKAAEMANNASVAWLKGGDALAALESASGTEQLFELNGDIRQQAIAVGNQAAALEKLKRLDEAMSAYRLSAKLLEQAGDYELRAYALQALSMLQLRKRHVLEAYATMQSGIMGVKNPNLKQRLLKSLIRIPYIFFK